MIKHFLNYSLRNLLRNKFYSLSVLFGFAVVMTACTYMILFYTHETNSDQFNRRYNRIYRVIMENPVFGAMSFSTFSKSADKLRTNFPEIEKVTFIQWIGRVTLGLPDRTISEERMLLVDSTFLQIFSYNVLFGNPNQCLNKPNSLVITESTARRMYGNSSPIGQSIRWNDLVLEVTALVEDPPGNSHLQFDLLISNTSLREANNSVTNATYILLHENVSLKSLRDKLNHESSSLSESFGKILKFDLQSLESAYFHNSDFLYDFANHVFRYRDHRVLTDFLLVAIMMLAVSIFNYITFSQAKASYRSKDISIRRILGSTRSQTLILFIIEALTILILSSFISTLLTVLLLPQFNFLTDSLIEIGYLLNGKVIISLFFLIIICGFLLGIVNYFIFSSLKTSDLLRGIKIRGNPKLIYSLCLLQFCAALMLSYLTIMMLRQINYMNTKPLGFNKENVVGISLAELDWNINPQTIKEEFSKLPGVIHSSLSSGSPISGRGFYSERIDGQDVPINTIIGDANYSETIGLELLEGRWFDSTLKSDSLSIVLNASGAKLFNVGLDSLFGGLFRVIGITKDFNYSSFRERIGPVVMYYRPYDRKYKSDAILLLRISNTTKDMGESLRKKWLTLFPMAPFNMEVIEDKYESLNLKDTKQAYLLGASALSTILITVFGLAGLSYFLAQQKSKNIAIRKIYGASSGRLIINSFGYVLLFITVSSVLVFPITDYLSHEWLSNFAYRTEVPFWLYIIMVIASLLVIWLSVFYQVNKVVRANPSEVLRNE
ncbi:MAG: ABC transporter permease [Cyclobacteriaceae bacterium]